MLAQASKLVRVFRGPSKAVSDGASFAECVRPDCPCKLSEVEREAAELGMRVVVVDCDDARDNMIAWLAAGGG